MTERGYLVPVREARFEQKIKGSRFIAIATRAISPEDATSAIDSVRKEYPDATHHCWAYLLGDPVTSSRMRMNDAGEPTGTAGKPILSVLQQKGVGDIVLVVVRYFGGTKLGAGGLVRAYSSTASGVMDALELITTSPPHDAVIHIDYPDEPSVRRLLNASHVSVLSTDYGERVQLTIRTSGTQWRAIAKALTDLTSGRAKLVGI